jgi:hypothetical protein
MVNWLLSCHCGIYTYPINIGGSGLGLFISKRLTEMHGGQIGFTSQRGVGSTFAFYVKSRKSTVPRRQSEDTTAAVRTNMRRQASVLTIQSRAKKDQPPDQPTANTTNPADLHILVVEDNLVNQRVLAKQLRNIGMKVTVSNHGGEALEHLQTTQYCVTDGAPLSIVLMDWEMPVKSLHPFKSESHTNFPGHERLNMRATHPRAPARRRYTWACACYCRYCEREVGASGGCVGGGYGRCYLEAVQDTGVVCLYTEDVGEAGGWVKVGDA